MHGMNTLAFLLITVLKNYVVGWNVRMAWLPGYAPPRLGDSFNDPYGLLKKVPFSHMLGVVYLNDDGTRLTPDKHPWDKEGTLFYQEFLLPLATLSKSYSKKKRDNESLTDDWDGEWCFRNHKEGDRTEYRYIVTNDNYVKPACQKSIASSSMGSEFTRNGFSIYESISFQKSLNGDKRYIKFFTLPQSNNIYKNIMVSILSPYFYVLEETFRPIHFKISYPKSVTANNPFTLKVSLLNEQKGSIGKSQYANMECMVFLSSENKTFTYREGKKYLQETKARLGGEDVTTMWDADQAIFVDFVNGEANTTLTIEDAHPRINLVAILKRNTYNYQAFPNFEAENIQLEVKEQIPAKLRILPGYKVGTDQVMNFPIEPPLQVELVDTNGYRIKSGLNSKLTIHATRKDKDIELAQESSFDLDRGIGTFRGSIVKKTTQAFLEFTATLRDGSTFTTDKTNFFDVGNRYVGILVDFTRGKDYYSMLADERNLGYENYLKAAMGSLENILIYRSFDPGFGRSLVSFDDLAERKVESAYDIRDTIENHRDYYEYIPPLQPTSKKAPHIKYIALVGSDDSNTGSFAATAAAYGLVTISDSSTSDRFRDKNKYPHLVRMAYSEEYRFTMMANFFKSRKWDYLIVITGKRQAIPASFAERMIHFNIRYYNIIFPSTIGEHGSLASPTQYGIDTFFQKIQQSEIKILVTMLEGIELTDLIEACVEKKSLNSDKGYTWIADGGMLSEDSPLDDISGDKKMARLKEFDKALSFESYYHDFDLNHDAYKRLNVEKYDPTWTRKKSTRQPYFMMYDAGSMVRDVIIRAQIEKITLTPDNILKLMARYGEKTSIKDIASKDEDLIEKNILGYGIKLDENYDRCNYTALLYQIDAEDRANFRKQRRYLWLGEKVTVKNISPNNIITETSTRTRDDFEIRYTNIQLTKYSDITINNGISEKAPKPFYCRNNCYGKGECIWNFGSHCKCQYGYSETSDCRDPICNDECKSGGICVSPWNCSCNAGFKHSSYGSDCADVHCNTNGMDCQNNATCIGPDLCECREHFYGTKCDKICDCENGICDDTNIGSGACDCKDTGYFGDRCEHDTLLVVLISTGFGLLIILVSAILIISRVRKMIKHVSLMNTDWKANWGEIKMRQANQKSSMKSMLSMISMMSAKSTKGDTKHFCQNQGEWNGREIVVKVIQKENLTLTDELRREIMVVREMHHPNLCLFIGACLESMHICILNEVCGKGSLEDILANDDIALGWDFRYSMLKDICRGMTYIGNSELKSHGRLKSSNCLVDNRWCVKLSDFGLQTFRSDQYGIREFSPDPPDASELEGCDYYNLLWTAPEILREGVSHLNHVADYRSRHGDIYSFAIIMVEMCTRQHPYHELSHLRSDELVYMISGLQEPCANVKLVESRDIDGIPNNVIRPQINEDDLPENQDQAEGLKVLIETCWNEDKYCRPDFAICGKCLNRISPHRGELMDNLIVLMEQYTSSLEAIVAERTANIQEEKAKSDLLLSKMLPPLIAEELKRGKNPQPEYFNSVTIYFSDVVGFSMICSQATPFEVVDILNGLYSVMDNIIDSFDCYKVETIADCYVVASGLPVRNGDRHAGEIASMALELLQGFNGISYVGYKNKQVQLRIGIHSGPIVAGVVGLKMPRYCLFGDTMNTASRMESGGFALKIHLSEDTYNLLQSIDGYIVECRGQIPVKGRGYMTTYWLKGRKGVDYDLPTEDMALSASQHHFK